MPQYTSPGAAASDAFTEFMTLRKAEQRQAMLDRLNEENIRSQMADREANRENQRATTEWLNEQRKGVARTSFASRHLPGDINPAGEAEALSLGMGDMLAPSMKPEDHSGGTDSIEVSKPGLQTPGLREDPSTSSALDPEASATGVESLGSTTPTLKGPQWLGLPEQRRTAEKDELMNTIIHSNILSNPSIPIQQKNAIWFEATGENLPNDLMAAFTTKGVWSNPRGGGPFEKLGDIPSNDQVVTEPAAQLPNYIALNMDGVWNRLNTRNANEPPQPIAGVGEGARVTPAGNAGQVPLGLGKALQEAIAAAQPRSFGRGPTEITMQQLQTVQMQVLAYENIPADIKDVLKKILTGPLSANQPDLRQADIGAIVRSGALNVIDPATGQPVKPSPDEVRTIADLLVKYRGF